MTVDGHPDVESDATAAVDPSIHETALTIRLTEQRLLDLFAAGKLFGTVHTCIGQEYSAAAVIDALEDGDYVFSNHRCHGHFLARTDDVEGLIAEIMGKDTGVCGGRGGSQHLCANGFFSNGVQGGIAPVSAGLALAHKLASSGKIAVVFIGDGTLGEGVLYEALNIASKWELPLLTVLENNRYSQSTAQAETLAGDIDARAAAFGIPTWHGETDDPAALVDVAKRAVDGVRASGTAGFLRVDTYRLMAHSKGDDDRDPAEVEAHWAKDPLVAYEKDEPERVATWRDAINARLDDAVAAADERPYAAPRDERSEEDAIGVGAERTWTAANFASGERVVARIRAALERGLAADDRVFVLGEDIESPYGGAFKVTQGLSHASPGRVRNTPISEAAIVGIANGLALSGRRPICEIMFGDFLTLAADQIINHAAKFRYMYADQVSMPVVIRTPMGGKRGYGATHSQSLENHFLGIPDTRVIALHHRYDPGAAYDTLLATIDRPTLVVENKLLYGVMASPEGPDGFVVEHDGARFPTTRLRPVGTPDVTVVCYGGSLVDVERAVERAFDDDEIVCEVIVPLSLYPLDVEPIRASVEATGRLVIVEEAQGFAGFGAEVIAQLAEVGVVVDCVRRVGPPAHAIPSCRPAETAVLPNPDSIVEAIQEIFE